MPITITRKYNTSIAYYISSCSAEMQLLGIDAGFERTVSLLCLSVFAKVSVMMTLGCICFIYLCLGGPGKYKFELDFGD